MLCLFRSSPVIVTNDAVNGSFVRQPPESAWSVLCVLEARESSPAFNYANEGHEGHRKGDKV